MNEIEPLGSGLKKDATKLVDNGESAVYMGKDTQKNIIENISNEIDRIVSKIIYQIESKQLNCIDRTKNFFHKYIKYKEKYLRLKSKENG